MDGRPNRRNEALVSDSSGVDWRAPKGAFHLVKNSENSGSGLNGKRFFGSPGWKIPRKSGTAQKVVPVVPLFLGIFRSGEPKKRLPFSPEPEFSEFLTKWKAP